MVATMQSIADAAGVSRATVSYVLNGRHIGSRMKINHVTVSKVEKIAELQGYCRNEIARAVKTGKTNAIGIVGGLSGSYCLEIIKGISDAGAAQGYFIKLFPAELSTDIEQIARQCAGQRLAGVICSSLSEEQLHLLRERLEGKHIPIVLVDNTVFIMTGAPAQFQMTLTVQNLLWNICTAWGIAKLFTSPMI